MSCAHRDKRRTARGQGTKTEIANFLHRLILREVSRTAILISSLAPSSLCHLLVHDRYGSLSMPLDSNCRLHSSQPFGLPLIPLVRPSPVFVLLVRPRPSGPGWLDFLVDGPDLSEVLYSAYKVPPFLASLLVMRKFSQHSLSLLRTRT